MSRTLWCSAPLMRSVEYCAAISRKSGLKPGRKFRYRSTLLLRRRRVWANIGRCQPPGVCCDISRQEANLGSKQAISQHTGRGFCGFLRLVWLVGLVVLPVREGQNATTQQCDNAVNPARQGSGVRPGAARRCGSKLPSEGRPAAATWWAGRQQSRLRCRRRCCES